MKQTIFITNDGSTSIQLDEWNETYHSKHGAIQEAYHVFIKNGLSLFQGKSVSILEIGFGTGLNALITFIEAKKSNQKINYVGVEAYPLSYQLAQQMNYPKELGDPKLETVFILFHESDWGKKTPISEFFNLTKEKKYFQEIDYINQFDLIYFDAFGYRVQPELWSKDIFQKMYNSMKNGGILVTYACRTSIKNAMTEAGFVVDKLKGAPGKREMLRAIKN